MAEWNPNSHSGQKPVSLSPCLPVSLSPPRPVGLLAGWGRFPVLVAQKCRSLGIPVVCVGIRRHASPELAGLVDRFYWAGVVKLGRVLRCFRREGVQRVVMAGKINKALIFSPWGFLSLLPDWRAIQFWYRRQRADNRDDTLLLGLVAEFERDGLHCESALDICPELLVSPGVLTRRRPTTHEDKDIRFGWNVAREMGRLDVGQSVSVKARAVLAVEAIEGTDQSIRRAGQLCPAGGFTVVKVAKPHQDMRFDVPTVGTSTIETMHQSGGRVLAIEATRTILIDPEQTIALADRHGISIVALTEPLPNP